MDFPRWVFTSPGPEKCNGGTYGQELVQDKDEYDTALSAGFHATIPEALNGDKGSPDEKGKPEEVEPKEADAVEAKPAETKQRGRPSKNGGRLASRGRRSRADAS